MVIQRVLPAAFTGGKVEVVDVVIVLLLPVVHGRQQCQHNISVILRLYTLQIAF